MFVAFSRLPVPVAVRSPSRRFQESSPPALRYEKGNYTQPHISLPPQPSLDPQSRYGSTARNIASELQGQHCFVRSLRGWLFVLSLLNCAFRAHCHITGVFFLCCPSCLRARYGAVLSCSSHVVTCNLRNSVFRSFVVHCIGGTGRDTREAGSFDMAYASYGSPEVALRGLAGPVVEMK